MGRGEGLFRLRLPSGLGLCDDVVSQLACERLVVVELELEGAGAAGHGLELDRVVPQLGHRNLSLDGSQLSMGTTSWQDKGVRWYMEAGAHVSQMDMSGVTYRVLALLAADE